MKTRYILMCIIFVTDLLSQNKPLLKLDQLIDEALESNLELRSISADIKAAEMKIPQASSLNDPELTFRLMEIPGFKPKEAMFANLEIMQLIRFPTKISTEVKIANLNTNRVHQEYNEKSVEIIMKVKIAFYELWMVQQNLALNLEKIELMKQFLHIAKTRYATGSNTQQDILRAQIEISKLNNERLRLLEMEETALAMLALLLNRDIMDFNGIADAPELYLPDIDINQIQDYGLKYCSRLRSDSLMVEQQKMMHRLAKLEYLPDFRLGLEYVTSPSTGFRGWSLTFGISLPFFPLTLAKANARVLEAEANILRSQSIYNNERNMLLSKIREYYAKLKSLKSQLDLYDNEIIPLAEQSLNGVLLNYQTGQTDFLMLLDTYKMLVMEKMEKIMTRMKFEETLADLEKEIGCRDIEEIL